jgi:hypothetical protein
VVLMVQWWRWSVLGLVRVGGCPEAGGVPAPRVECERLGDRCDLAEGVLGVCNDNGRTDCAAPPCLSCVAQH